MKKLFPLVIVVTFLAVSFFISCALIVKEEIVYKVNSTSSLTADNIKYTDADGNIVDLNNISLPWTKTIKITYGDDKEFKEASLTAETSAGVTADVTATITWSK
jgi:hypothetical protein